MDAPSSSPPLGLARAVVWRLLAPAAIGAATGAIVAAASSLTEDRALGALASLPDGWPALLCPLALLVTLAVATFVTRATRPSTAELYIVTYHADVCRLPLRQIPGRVLAAMTTVGFGGSQGLESPSALTGAGMGDALGRVVGSLPEQERRSLIVAGASAGIAAVFSSPGVGMLYGIEIPFRRDVDARRLVPCAIAAAAAFAVRDALVGARRIAVLESTPVVDATFALGVALVAIGCGVGARLFAETGEWLKGLARGGTPLGRAVVAGAVLAGLAWTGHALTGSWITFGPGYVASDWVRHGSYPIWLLLATLVIRAAGTLTCVYGGGGGGVFTSLACCGVFVGQIVGELVGRTESDLFPFLGAACFLGSGYRLPLACMMLVLEGATSISVAVAGLVAIAIGQVLMGRESVSDAKRDHRMD
ncbi:MAG TPA: chloride channel protein [Candidatus Binatia bacterium]|nr:chloride channel protein [Candidatus Binatia bacterium]